MNNSFGISDKSYLYLQQAFAKYSEIDKVTLFGSRAKGNYKNGSDIDLAVSGKKLTAKLILDIKGYINEELPIPYHVDIVDYNTLNHVELKEHINRVGKVFFTREPRAADKSL